MFKKSSIIAMAIVMFVSFNSVVFAGNNKTNCNSGVNPAGKSDKPGFDNGNAWWKTDQKKQDRWQHRNRNRNHNRDWWKNSQCVDIVDSLELDNDALKADNDSLRAQIEALLEENDSLRAQIEALLEENDSLRAQIEALQDENTDPVEVETRQVRLQVHEEQYGGNAEFYYIAYSQDQHIKDTIRQLGSGQYEIKMVVSLPDGEEISINSYFNGQDVPLGGREINIRNQ